MANIILVVEKFLPRSHPSHLSRPLGRTPTTNTFQLSRLFICRCKQLPASCPVSSKSVLTYVIFLLPLFTVPSFGCLRTCPNAICCLWGGDTVTSKPKTTLSDFYLHTGKISHIIARLSGVASM